MREQLFRLSHRYFSDLCNDAEFEQKENRAYYIIRNLQYKNQKIDVAVPLRSNINANFQKDSDYFIATIPTMNTHVSNGNIAGWHLIKMIPIFGSEIYPICPLQYDKQIALYVIDKYDKQKLHNTVQQLL